MPASQPASPGHGSMPGKRPDKHLDIRARRFALMFPLFLSLALVGGGLLLNLSHSGGFVLPWGGNAVPVAVFLAVAVVFVVLFGAGIGIFGSRTTLSGTVRRVMLGVAMAAQLITATLFAAALLGQAGNGPLPPERVDEYVLLMGSGLSLAMGLVLALTFKPEEQWSASDDAAFAAALESATDPFAAKDRMTYFLHPRSSIIIMILLAAIMPGLLLALLSPWILLGLALLALAIVALLCGTVEVNREQLTVKIMGVLPAIIAPCEGLDGAVSLAVSAGTYGGWGLRKHSGTASFLTDSGAAVVLRQNDGATLAVGAPTLDMADQLAEILNRRAGKSPQRR